MACSAGIIAGDFPIARLSARSPSVIVTPRALRHFQTSHYVTPQWYMIEQAASRFTASTSEPHSTGGFPLRTLPIDLSGVTDGSVARKPQSARLDGGLNYEMAISDS
jgi:hypothetical protein